jgi:hypothetical protein
MGFSIKTFNIKGNLVFMNNLYHKVVVASVCTALGFAIGVNEKAYSATFNTNYPYPLMTFHVIDGGSFGSFDGLGDRVYNVGYPDFESFGGDGHSWSEVERTTVREIAALTEFSIPNLTGFSTGDPTDFRTDTRITNIINAVLRIEVRYWYPSTLGLFGYVGNGIAEASDFEAGVFLGSTTNYEEGEYKFAYFNVTSFLNGLVNNNNEFAGFALRSLTGDTIHMSIVDQLFTDPPRLFVEAEYEVVPEPTTIFGSAIGLCLGGWLKRKKSTSQNKTKSQA